MNAMIRKVKNSIILGLFMLISVASLAQDDKEKIVVPLTTPGKAGTLEVGLVYGSIKVTGYDGKDVIVTTFMKNKGYHSEATKGGMKRIENRSMQMTVEEKDNNVQISTDSWNHTLGIEVLVPSNFSLKLSTVNDGDILVDNVKGEIEANNVNGEIKMTNISGSALLNTVNGDVFINFKEVTAGKPMAFTTLNGDVDVTFPPLAKFNLKMKSEQGEIYSDFDFETIKVDPRVENVNKGNYKKYTIESWVNGKVNGGGPEMLLKTMNGDILIRKSK
jgi:hypothetical protein